VLRLPTRENKIRWEDFKVRTYTPDFYVTSKSGKEIIIETKGRFVATDRAKHLSIRKQFADTYDIRFLFSNPNVKLSKASKTTYAMCGEATRVHVGQRS
jgi:hypothetical protein